MRSETRTCIVQNVMSMQDAYEPICLYCILVYYYFLFPKNFILVEIHLIQFFIVLQLFSSLPSMVELLKQCEQDSIDKSNMLSCIAYCIPHGVNRSNQTVLILV